MNIELADKTPDPVEILQRYRKRKLSAFMREPDPGNHADTIVWDAFWNLIYDGASRVDHSAAKAIERELTECDHTVGDVLDGWRPASIRRLVNA